MSLVNFFIDLVSFYIQIKEQSAALKQYKLFVLKTNEYIKDII